MTRAAVILERLRQSFWVLPGLGILIAVVAGMLVPALDDSIDVPGVVRTVEDPDTARSVLQVVTTVAVSVAGISFSVMVVALVLASQQLSPRVLRSFQSNSLNQGVLALYLATAGFSLFVLIAVGGQERVPDLSIALAVTMTVLSLALFVRFLHHMVRSLNASAVIRRIAAEGHRAIDEPYPRRTGKSPRDVRAAERRAAWIADRFPATAVTAPRAGYIASVKASDLLRAAERCAGMVEQSRAIGDFVVSGGVLAKVHCPGDKLEHLVRKVGGAFVLNEERIVDDDVAFPIRQLTDIALKGLSPSINDPTTAENAMDSVADSLVRLSRQDAGQLLRTDDAGEPRFRARAPSFDDLVRLGFDQVRRDAARRPSFAVRLIELLAEIRDVGGEPARRSEEIPRQAALIFEHASSLADLTADGLMVRDAYERFMRQPAGGDSPEPPSRTPAHPAS